MIRIIPTIKSKIDDIRTGVQSVFLFIFLGFFVIQIRFFVFVPKRKRRLLIQSSFSWWEMVDSNHRRHRQQIYSLSPLATREIPHILYEIGAGGRIRTPDLLITNQLLYQLSYTSTTTSEYYAITKAQICQ